MQLRDTLGLDEKRAIIQSARDRLHFSSGEDLVVEGDRPMRCVLVTSGFACRYRLLPSGERQIMAIHLPGDFVDLHSFLLKEMDHSVGALTECTAVGFPHESLLQVTERFPHLTRMLWLMTLIDAAGHREWLIGLGLLSAPQRTARLFCEIYKRLEIVGLARDHEFRFPVTQVAMGDALGISAVHVNRVVQELRQQDLITWERGTVRILDWSRLVATGQFSDRYLHLVREPR
ncbi:hypothetical protein VE26_04665 [Devosia chinhatensis]|uniref:HTH crp-type domain-containing protein n=1 Tax=Devosia chinhatensis TaxID=429727 RepID=A0A0F5FQ20_9HYPH|nr:hypothetical protein VE26_04665 [Devosia chinhatensis]